MKPQNIANPPSNSVTIYGSGGRTGLVWLLATLLRLQRSGEYNYLDDNFRVGPDHKFSMNPKTWSEMVKESRRLEKALGNGLKVIEKNELDTVVVQRRSLHVNRFIKKGSKINKNDIICLRPCLKGSINPYEFELIKNKVLKKDLEKGEIIFWKDLT